MAIIKKEAFYVSSTGINNIHCCIWQDDEMKPKALFQIAHGVSEHIERYDDFARFLASNGFVVFGNDHLGHGQSANSIEELGFFAEEDGDLRLVDDMHILSIIMKKRFPELPLVLFGHSMGSLCARVYASSFPNELSALILCGTGELPSSAVVLEEPLRFFCKKLGAETQLSNSLFDKIVTIGIKNKKTDKDWLSSNE
ncbi:MAG: alpha/beta fold hydrolase, partial [Acutalibacteraceae bacterium]